MSQTNSNSQAVPSLFQLFSSALSNVNANRQEINDLDGYNGNHGDNMVQNLQLVTSLLGKQTEAAPAEALRSASQLLQAQGRGGTSKYYSQGLEQAAEKLTGHTQLQQDDVMTLVQSLLGAVPAESTAEAGISMPSVLDLLVGLGGGQAAAQPKAAPQPAEPSAPSIMDLVMGLAGGQEAPAQPQAQPQAQSGGGIFDLLQGLAGAAMGQPQQAQASTPQAESDGLDAGDLLERLLPAGLAFLQAKQAGADTSQAAQQALIRALLGGQAQPQQARTPRAAAGSLIAQGMLKALLGGR